jgi:nucleotide-binding universal stress UspA family protein
MSEACGMRISGKSCSAPIFRRTRTGRLSSRSTRRCATPGSELHLLHVIPEPPAQFWKGYIYEVDEDVDARARREIDEKLAQTYRPRVPAGVPLVIAMRIGEAGHQILDYAQEQDIDLVIVGRQGAGAMGKILFGNVTERVVRKAPCPVLVIPPSGK